MLYIIYYLLYIAYYILYIICYILDIIYYMLYLRYYIYYILYIIYFIYYILFIIYYILYILYICNYVYIYIIYIKLFPEIHHIPQPVTWLPFQALLQVGHELAEVNGVHVRDIPRVELERTGPGVFKRNAQVPRGSSSIFFFGLPMWHHGSHQVIYLRTFSWMRWMSAT